MATATSKPPAKDAWPLGRKIKYAVVAIAALTILWFVFNFADINVMAELKRIDGVGFADIMGQREYAMRVWLKPDRMTSYDISAEDIINALRNQNLEAAPGKIGESSGRNPQSLQYVLRYTGKFTQQKQYPHTL